MACLLALSECDQDLTSAKNQPLVGYILVVTDSVSHAPLDSVRISVLGYAGDTAVYYSDSTGHAKLPALASSRTVFSFDKIGYRPLDFIDTVNSPPDTITHQPLPRLVSIRMIPLDSGLMGQIGFPKDTLLPADTLVFHFAQPVAYVDEATLRLTNLSGVLWVDARLDSAKKTLRIVQKDADWLPGKTYGYELVLRDAHGNYFKAPGDSSNFIRGTFFVRQTQVDTTLNFPSRFRIAYFNSGGFSRFDSLNTDTSPLGDSTTRFARLKWDWDSTGGRRVDSMVILIKDQGAAAPSWTVWTTLPGGIDSATLDFADLYSTHNGLSQKPDFPLRTSSTASIQLRVIPKDGLSTVDARDTILAPVTQGMGPSLYANYDVSNGNFQNVADARDSIPVTFLTDPGDANSVFDFGPDFKAPIPLLNGKIDTTTMTCRWTTPSSAATLYYAFNGQPPPLVFMQADVNGFLYRGKPVWIRNRLAIGVHLQ